MVSVDYVWKVCVESFFFSILPKVISAYPQIIRQPSRATAAQFSPASGWEQRQRSPFQVLHHHVSIDRPKMETKLLRQKTSGSRSSGAVRGLPLSVHSPGLPSTTPASDLHMTPGSVAEAPPFLGLQNGIDLRIWYKSWRGSSRIQLQRQQPWKICQRLV